MIAINTKKGSADGGGAESVDGFPSSRSGAMFAPINQAKYRSAHLTIYSSAIGFQCLQLISIMHVPAGPAARFAGLFFLHLRPVLFHRHPERRAGLVERVFVLPGLGDRPVEVFEPLVNIEDRIVLSHALAPFLPSFIEYHLQMDPILLMLNSYRATLREVILPLCFSLQIHIPRGSIAPFLIRPGARFRHWRVWVSVPIVPYKN